MHMMLLQIINSQNYLLQQLILENMLKAGLHLKFKNHRKNLRYNSNPIQSIMQMLKFGYTSIRCILFVSLLMTKAISFWR